jgi:hypothetical protein
MDIFMIFKITTPIIEPTEGSPHQASVSLSHPIGSLSPFASYLSAFPRFFSIKARCSYSF